MAGGAGPPCPAEVLARQDTLSGSTRAPLYGPVLYNLLSFPTLLQHLFSAWLLHKDEGGGTAHKALLLPTQSPKGQVFFQAS